MKDVLRFVQRVGNDQPEGVSLTDISHHLGEPPFLCDDLKCLVDDGELYTTIDDEHFAVVGGN